MLAHVSGFVVNLPNYFLVDLPPEAQLSAGMLTEACQTLKRNRTQFLAHRPTQGMVEVLSHLAKSWQQLDDPFRKLALEQGPAATGWNRNLGSPGVWMVSLQCPLRRLVDETFVQDHRNCWSISAPAISPTRF